MDKHDKKDLACFVFLVVTLLGLWVGGYFMAYG